MEMAMVEAVLVSRYGRAICMRLYLTLESITKRHLDRFRHFHRADSCRQSTDTQTHTNHALSATLDTDQKLPVSTPAAVDTVLSVVIDCAAPSVVLVAEEVAIIVSTSDNSRTKFLIFHYSCTRLYNNCFTTKAKTHVHRESVKI